MIGSFVTRTLALIIGYAYPAYECFKTVELNRPDVEQLIFWCQYWVLVAVLTVFERVGENFISWIPMYGEAKLAFFVYLWYPKTKGTTYVYETFFRPYITKHENEIDRNLLELRTRAGDMAGLYFQKAASFGQTSFFEILQYIASRSPSQSSRPRPAQRPQAQQIRRTSSAKATHQSAVAQQQPTSVPPSPTKRQPQEPSKASAPPAPAASVSPLPTSSSIPTRARPEATSLPKASSLPKPTGEGETVQDAVAKGSTKEDPNPDTQETPIEEAIRMTRARLRKRAAISGPSTR